MYRHTTWNHSTESTAVRDESAPSHESVETRDTRSGAGTVHADVLAGVKGIAPLLPPGAAVGLVTGIAATSVGLSPTEAVAMSVFVYSPTVMLTALDLLEAGTPAVILVGTSLLVGIRFMLLSVSIASYFESVATRWKWLLAYFLWTPIFALSVERFDAEPTTSRRGYYLGAAIPLWITFHAAVFLGVAFGASVPTGWQMGFVVPLAFIALLMRMLRNRPTNGAALVAGVVAVLASTLPFNVGILVAVVCGTGVGVVLRYREDSS